MRAVQRLSPKYRELVETATLDSQVACHVWLSQRVHEHSANEVKARAIYEIGVEQHGQAAFDEAVRNYQSLINQQEETT